MPGSNWWEPYEAVVFDLDGTLLRLDVDWREVESDVGAVLEAEGLDPEAHHAWELLDVAESVGRHDDVDQIIADHELEGARTAERLPLADTLVRIDRPIGVVSLNSVHAVRVALEQAGLLDAVAVVVGRGSVPERKPSPVPLLVALEALGVDPSAAIFVGDSTGDETTARRAGVDFRPVAE